MSLPQSFDVRKGIGIHPMKHQSTSSCRLENRRYDTIR